MPNPDFTATDWAFILNTLRDGRCILLLGPEIAQTTAGPSFQQAFARSMTETPNPLVASFYENDELFLFPDARAKSRVYYQMKAFYQQGFQADLYEKIGALPLKMILNASPDRFLTQTLGDGNYEFAYFHKSDPREVKALPQKEKPLVYNLLGTLEEEESLLLTHDDLYEYLEAILSRQGLPRVVSDEIFEARSLIFLGVGFDKWYVQLLLRLLKVHDGRSRFARYATQQSLNADTLSICVDQFKIEFIGTGSADFIQALHQRCAEEGLLREKKSAAQSPRDKVRELVEQDELSPALEYLKALFEGAEAELFDEVIGLSARYNRLQKRIHRKVIETDKAEVDLARIREAVLDLSHEIA